MKQTTLNQKYDGQDIQTLESEVRNNLATSREAQAEMIEILVYLKTSSRYKENKRYSKESFTIYLTDCFGIREHTFQDWQRAVTLFKDEVIKHGIGLVAKTLKLCGPNRTKIVFSEINRLEDIKKAKSIPREKIEIIIQNNRKTAKIEKTYTDWRAMYEQEKLTHARTFEAYREAKETIKELEAQIAKLKATARKVTESVKLLQMAN